MASNKGNNGSLEKISPTSPQSDVDPYEPTFSPEASDSPTPSSVTVGRDNTSPAPTITDTAAAAMEYDPMMMDDDQALGPTVKIHEVGAT
ncbi:hypothetical protein CONLIGDRAFT_425001 [Coniochaeta ligniaria NRRL 30616]|uniref:Uncharacterized protein n=1 Tax=Coniochaeta ligniaria NRRL 30616 TaxID=1408157 RepID=A0A1J7IHY4_9PEZI|nr:hypothetical protein CONLIGDRAFT_425001 [Coniochaeta ligniaria NRRL 30616]